MTTSDTSDSDEFYVDATSHDTANEAYNADTASEDADHVDYSQGLDGYQGKQEAIGQIDDQEKHAGRRRDKKQGSKEVKGMTDESKGVQPDKGPHGNIRQSDKNGATGGHRPVSSIEPNVSDVQTHVQTESDEIRIVLVGHTGNGKSATGNTILGKVCFESKARPTSITKKCQLDSYQRNDKKVVIVDTPGLFDTRKTPTKELTDEINKSVGVCLPGPHVIIYVLRISVKFTKEEEDSVKKIIKILGKDVFRFVIFLFTGKDCLDKDQTLDNYLEEVPSNLGQFLKSANNRTIAFDNTVGTKEEKIQQVNALFSKIDSLITKNDKRYYTNKSLTKIEKEVNDGEPNESRDQMRQNILKGNKKIGCCTLL